MLGLAAQRLDRPQAADQGGDGLGLARVASRLVTPTAAMPDGGVPSSSGMIIGISFVLAPAFGLSGNHAWPAQPGAASADHRTILKSRAGRLIRPPTIATCSPTDATGR